MTRGATRYSRHELLPEWGAAGQERLRQATVLIVGCGALGANQAQLLARAGVGRLIVADRDVPELHNLHRQPLFDEDDVAAGTPKALAAAARLRRINSEIAVEALVIDVNPQNVEALVARADLVLDGADNFETRFLLNDVCVKLGKPWIYGGVIGAEGMLLVVRPGVGPCLRCALPDLPVAGSLPTCETAGVLNAAPALIAALQVAEACKLLLGAGEPATGMLHVDLWRARFRTFAVRRHPDCPACGKRDFEFLTRRRESWTARLCGRNAVQVTPPAPADLALDDLAEKLGKIGRVARNGFFLNFKIEPYELTIFPDGRLIVKGTNDEAVARALYAKYLGG
jgi:adenylyltransferase/sulfurtransferase